ncbi:MAG: hypothetical protein AAGJ74_11650 [Pseudomonadota bacterium]
MGGTMADGQRDIFMERLARIEKGGVNTVGTMHIGPAEIEGDSGKVKVRRKRKPLSMAAVGRWFMMLVIAGIVGFTSMLSGRVAAFHMLNADVEMPWPPDHIALYADISIAFLLMTMFAWAFQWGSLQRIVLMAGLLSVMLGEAAMMREAPFLFEAMYTPEYVAEAVATPAPPSPLVQIEDLATLVGL